MTTDEALALISSKPLGSNNKDQKTKRNSQSRLQSFLNAKNLENDVVDDNEYSNKRSTNCTWRPFESLYNDLKGYKNRFTSDFILNRESWISESLQILSTSLFIYFVSLAPTITFGSMLNRNVDSKTFNISRSVFAVAIAQIITCIFGGQPLIITGITGPIYILEDCLAKLISDPSKVLPHARFLTGLYCSVFGFLFTVFNFTNLVNYVRRSTEEIFSFFISFFFLFKATKALLKPFSIANKATQELEYYRYISKAMVGSLLAGVMIVICIAMNKLKRSNYLRRSIRSLCGFLSVPIGLILCVIIKHLYFSKVESVDPIKMSSNTTFDFLQASFDLPSDWQKIPLTISDHVYCVILGLCLGFVIVSDSLLAGLAIAKTERKLTKPPLFSLDICIISFFIPLLCGIFNWPFLCHAAVRSNSHVIALTKWNTKVPPGLPHEVVGVIEQRFSGLIISFMILGTVFLPSRVFLMIPMPALYGLFLYIGLMGLKELVVYKRSITLCRLRKYWKDRPYLNPFPTKALSCFVLIELITIGLLISMDLITEYTGNAIPAMIFPILLMIYAVVREFLLPRFSCLALHIDMMDGLHNSSFLDKKDAGDYIILLSDDIQNHNDLDEEDILRAYGPRDQKLANLERVIEDERSASSSDSNNIFFTNNNHVETHQPIRKKKFSQPSLSRRRNQSDLTHIYERIARGSMDRRTSTTIHLTSNSSTGRFQFIRPSLFADENGDYEQRLLNPFNFN